MIGACCPLREGQRIQLNCVIGPFKYLMYKTKTACATLPGIKGVCHDYHSFILFFKIQQKLKIGNIDMFFSISTPKIKVEKQEITNFSYFAHKRKMGKKSNMLFSGRKRVVRNESGQNGCKLLGRFRPRYVLKVHFLSIKLRTRDKKSCLFRSFSVSQGILKNAKFKI